jgi:hypothetical protein
MADNWLHIILGVQCFAVRPGSRTAWFQAGEQFHFDMFSKIDCGERESFVKSGIACGRELAMFIG